MLSLSLSLSPSLPLSQRGDLTSSALPRHYYSAGVLYSPEARRRPVQPDLNALPRMFSSSDARYEFARHACGGPGCPAAGGGPPLWETYDRDRAWFGSAGYHRQRGVGGS